MKGYRYKMSMDGYNEGKYFYVYQLSIPDHIDGGEGPAYESEAVEFPDSVAVEFATNGSTTPPRAVLVDAEGGGVFERFEYEWR